MLSDLVMVDPFSGASYCWIMSSSLVEHQPWDAAGT